MWKWFLFWEKLFPNENSTIPLPSPPLHSDTNMYTHTQTCTQVCTTETRIRQKFPMIERRAFIQWKWTRWLGEQRDGEMWLMHTSDTASAGPFLPGQGDYMTKSPGLWCFLELYMSPTLWIKVISDYYKKRSCRSGKKKIPEMNILKK